ncbi:hypothetical protein [Streptomyces sp. R02]|uniref:Uncharacterized protein n=1 Tax=Streptomyces sp. R02 TaxID=3238623 RepID=A0AB39LEI6_9ACTN
MDVNSNITGSYAEPGFHHEARYEIKVHFDGAGQETLTYRFSFGEPDANGRQPMRLTLTGSDAREHSAEGVRWGRGERYEGDGRSGRAAHQGSAHAPVTAAPRGCRPGLRSRAARTAGMLAPEKVPVPARGRRSRHGPAAQPRSAATGLL